MQGQELRDEIAMMLKALRKANYENFDLVRQKFHIAYKCSNNQDALAWNIYEQAVTVKELTAFLDEVPDDLFVRLEHDYEYGGTTISFTSEEKETDEYWHTKLTRFYNQLLYKKKQQEKELQLEPIRKKVINKEGLTIQELDFLFNK